MSFEQLWDLLEAIQGQIRVFDNKAQVAIGINGVLIGFLVAEIGKAAECGTHGIFRRLLITYILVGSGLAVSVVAAALAVYVVHPQIELKQPRSHFFYCHIAEKYGRNFDLAVDRLKRLSSEDAIDEVAGQVAANAIICDIKAKRCKPALLLTVCALTLYALSIIPYASMASGHTNDNSSIGTGSSLAIASSPRVERALGADLSKGDSPVFPYAIPIATIGGALVALMGVGVTLWGSRRNAKEQNALASRMKLADFREAWLNRLRDSISELEAEILTLPSVSTSAMRRAFELATKIRLLMNRRDPRYTELDELLFAITNNDLLDSRFKLASELTELTQDILKAEWGVLKQDLKYEHPQIKH